MYHFSPFSRVLVWFSCGAASAVAAKMAIEKYGKRVFVIYCDTHLNENPDNVRFCNDIEQWLGVSVQRLSSDKYSTIEEVFEKTKYMSGPYGARCTVELKKRPRFDFQLPDDIHIFGMTLDENRRINLFEKNNPELCLDWILRDSGITKEVCLSTLVKAGIELPVMYKLGFKNNNCLGCVKSSSPAYWNLTRKCFPEVFKRRAEQSRKLGVRLVKLKGVRIFLDELPPARLRW